MAGPIIGGRFRHWRRASPYPTRVSRLARAIGAIAVVLVFLPPLALLVSGSVHRPGLPPPPTPRLVPERATVDPYVAAWEIGGLGRAALNSLMVAAVVVPVGVLVASLAGFALTRLPRRLVAVVGALSVVELMMPAVAVLVPRFAIFRFFGLTDTLVPLLAPALVGASPIHVLLFYLAFRAVPGELYETCRLHDLTPMQTWWRVALPLVGPVTAALAALTFVLTWSSFLDPLVYVYDRDLFTLPLALRSLSTIDPTNFPVFLAGAVIATVPALVVFALAQRPFRHLPTADSRTGWFRR